MTAMVTGNKTATKEVRGPNFYASPYAALPPLLVAEGKRLPKKLWEPFCGDGALVLPLRNRGFDVTATDLNAWGCPDSIGGVDFLSDVAGIYRPFGTDWGIVSNPPFGDVEQHIERAVGLSPYVAMLLRLAFLESAGRMQWFPQVGLRRVHVIGERLPMMHRHGYDGPKLKTGGMCFAWFIFEPGKRPQKHVPLRWVSWKAAARLHPQGPGDTPPIPTEQLGLFSEAFS